MQLLPVFLRAKICLKKIAITAAGGVSSSTEANPGAFVATTAGKRLKLFGMRTKNFMRPLKSEVHLTISWIGFGGMYAFVILTEVRADVADVPLLMELKSRVNGTNT